jgi:hypothetical protein
MCDRSGNIFVCGAIDSTSSGTNFHALTAVFSPSGNLIWSSLYAPLFEAVSFAFDSSDNLYVLGNIRLAAYRYDAALLKYDASGNLLWEKPIADTTTQNGQRIIFDGSGSFFISLTQVDLISHSADITLMKIDTAGNKIWRRDFNGPWSQSDICEEMVLDNNLNPILTGYSDSLDYDIVVVKYDSSGNYLWNYRYAGAGNNWDWPKDVTVDELNNIYVTGKVNDSNYVEQCITLKFDPAGNLLWDALYEGNGSTQQHVGNVIAVSDSGRVLVLGVTRDSYIMILVYDASGNQIFLDTTLVSGYFYNDIRTDILTDENETFYITSCIYNWSNMTDVVTIKYADILLKTEEHEISSNGLSAFPNPFSTTFTLSFFSDKDIAATVEIINSAGLKLSEEKIRLQKGKNQFQLDASLLSAGLYTIVLKKPDGEMASKRIISIR